MNGNSPDRYQAEIAAPLKVGAMSLPSRERRGPHNCIVVDDDPDICDLISRVLSRIGVSSAGVASARALHNALATTHPTFIFLDIGLGGWDAVDGIRLLGEHRFKGAVQLISGKQPALLNDVRALGERRGLNMLTPLQKPFRPDHVIGIVSGEQPSTTPRPSAVDNDCPASDAAVPADVTLAIAIDHSWLDVLYQPKIDLSDGAFIGAEGLARIRHPIHGLLAPAAFLPNASSDDVERLTEFVVLKAFRDWEILKNAGFNVRLAVNAPVAALSGTRLPQLIRENHPRSEDWPGLIIEITESDAINDIALTTEIAVQLRIYDVDLAIDDFGIGYSSFNRLKQFGFCELKLDRSYVQNCAVDPVNSSICEGVVNLAHAFDAVAVAEGIECAEERDALVAMGCDLAQGYFFAQPMTTAGMIRMHSDR